MYPAFPSAPSVSRRTRLLTRTALSGALLAAASGQPASAVTPIQQYYTSAGGTTPGGMNAPTVSVGNGLTTITINDPRTYIETTNTTVTRGQSQVTLSDFNPTPAQAFEVHFGAGTATREWIAIIHSTGLIEIDGSLRSYLGTGTTTVGGNLWLLGDGGVSFTNHANVITGGLLATTSDISKINFLSAAANNAGATSFSFDSARNTSASVALASGAQIAGNGGTLAFVAPYVSVASGALVSGTNGTQVLYGSANRYTVSFGRDSGNDFDLLSFEVDLNQNDGSNGNGSNTLLDLNGTTTTAGNIYVSAVNKAQLASSVVNLGGTMTATKATSSDGNIVLSAGGALASGPTGVAPKTGIDTAGNPSFVTSVRQVDLNVSSNFNASGNLIAAATGSILTKTTTLANFTSGGDMILRAGRTIEQSSSVVDTGGYGPPVMYIDPQSTARRGGIFLNSVTVGDDLLVQAVNGRAGSLPQIANVGGGIDIAAVHLSGISDAKGDPLGFDSGGDGVHALITTVASGDLSNISADDVRIALGRPTPLPTGQFTGHSASDDVRVRSAGGAHIEVQSDLHLTEVNAAGQALGVADNGELFLKASGSITVGTAIATNGNVVIDAGNAAVAAGSVQASGPLSITGRSVSINQLGVAGDASVTATAGNILLGDGSSISIGGSFDLHASGNLTVGQDNTGYGYSSISANGTTSFTAGGSATLGDVSTQSDLSVTATGGITGGTLSAGGNLLVQASAGNVSLGGASTNEGDIAVSGRAIQITDLAAGTNLTLTASAGDIVVNSGRDTYVYGDVVANASGNLTIGGHANGYGYGLYSNYGNASLTAGGNISVDEINVGGALGLHAASLNATGSFYANGAITGVFTGDANFQQVTTSYNAEGGSLPSLGSASADPSKPGILINSSNGNISALGFTADGDLSVSAAAGGLQAGSVSAAGNLSLFGADAYASVDLFAGPGIGEPSGHRRGDRSHQQSTDPQRRWRRHHRGEWQRHARNGQHAGPDPGQQWRGQHRREQPHDDWAGGDKQRFDLRRERKRPCAPVCGRRHRHCVG